MNIRLAEPCDIGRLAELLYQVHDVHSAGRPDIFRKGNRKYNDEELLRILENESTPVFVATDDEGYVLGYAFCILEEHRGEAALTDRKTLYIDDLCVDEAARGKGIGRELYNFAVNFAKESGCYNLTLNVWVDNVSALGFYEALGLHKQKIGMELIL